MRRNAARIIAKSAKRAPRTSDHGVPYPRANDPRSTTQNSHWNDGTNENAAPEPDDPRAHPPGGLGDDGEAVTSASQTTNVCVANPDPATPDFNQVDTPSTGDAVSSAVTVKGRILAFEATFKIEIFDAGGKVLAQVVAMSSEEQVLAPFEVQVPFSVSAETPACMWVYESSARDGSPTNVRQIPLRLLPAATAGGLPGTGESAPPGSGAWPAGAALAGMLVLLLGATALVVAMKRR